MIQLQELSRVSDILDTFDSTHWLYVPTLQNPENDVISRGVPAAELNTSHRFFTGPAFLLNAPDLVKNNLHGKKERNSFKSKLSRLQNMQMHNNGTRAITLLNLLLSSLSSLLPVCTQ
jgi:hypothetical protein